MCHFIIVYQILHLQFLPWKCYGTYYLLSSSGSKDDCEKEVLDLSFTSESTSTAGCSSNEGICLDHYFDILNEMKHKILPQSFLV